MRVVLGQVCGGCGSVASISTEYVWEGRWRWRVSWAVKRRAIKQIDGEVYQRKSGVRLLLNPVGGQVCG